jgi:hypothetical protein
MDEKRSGLSLEVVEAVSLAFYGTRPRAIPAPLSRACLWEWRSYTY